MKPHLGGCPNCPDGPCQCLAVGRCIVCGDWCEETICDRCRRKTEEYK